MKLRAGLAALLAGCASTPDFLPARTALLERTDVVCWIAASDNIKQRDPGLHGYAVSQVSLRQVGCEPEIVENGRLAVVEHFKHERAVKADVERRNAETAGSILKGAAIIGGAILLAPAFAPPPPPVVNCRTYQVTRNQSHTTCQ